MGSKPVNGLINWIISCKSKKNYHGLDFDRNYPWMGAEPPQYMKQDLIWLYTTALSDFSSRFYEPEKNRKTIFVGKPLKKNSALGNLVLIYWRNLYHNEIKFFWSKIYLTQLGQYFIYIQEFITSFFPYKPGKNRKTILGKL